MRSIEGIGVVGLGLIGGSVALAVRERHPALRVVGFSRRRSTLDAALAAGTVTECRNDFAAELEGIDLLVLATPPDATVRAIERLAGAARRPVVTDTAGVKAAVVAAASRALGPGHRFVGSHPVAGSERSGLAAARADLFERRTVIVTPADDTDPAAAAAVADFWTDLGARILRMDPDGHDRALALTSHLPHLVAFALADALRRADGGRLAACVGTGFLDTTRIAKSAPDLWAEIFAANRTHVIERLGGFRRSLDAIEKAVAAGDAETLKALLDAIRTARERLDG